MINSVSNIAFRNNAVPAGKDLAAPGKYSALEMQPDSFESEGKSKKSKKGLAIGLGTLAVAIGAFAGLGYAVKSGKLKSVEGAEKFVDKYLKNPAVKVGEFAETCWTKVTNLFSRKAAETVANPE